MLKEFISIESDKAVAIFHGAPGAPAGKLRIPDFPYL